MWWSWQLARRETKIVLTRAPSSLPRNIQFLVRQASLREEEECLALEALGLLADDDAALEHGASLERLEVELSVPGCVTPRATQGGPGEHSQPRIGAAS